MRVRRVLLVSGLGLAAACRAPDMTGTNAQPTSPTVASSTTTSVSTSRTSNSTGTTAASVGPDTRATTSQRAELHTDGGTVVADGTNGELDVDVTPAPGWTVHRQAAERAVTVTFTKDAASVQVTVTWSPDGLSTSVQSRR